MMYKKSITKKDNDNFWAAFDMRHPEISKELNREYVEDSIGFTAFQPTSMDNDTFRIFQRYLERWLSDNGFIEPRIDLIYVSANEDKNKGVRAIDTASIVKIDLDDKGKTRIIFKEDGTDNMLSIYVDEDLEKLKASVYIF